MMTELNVLAQRFLKIMLSFFDMVFLNIGKMQLKTEISLKLAF